MSKQYLKRKIHIKITLFSCVIHHTVIFFSHVAEDLLTGEEPIQIEEMDLKFNSDFFSACLVSGGH